MDDRVYWSEKACEGLYVFSNECGPSGHWKKVGVKLGEIVVIGGAAEYEDWLRTK